MEWIFANVPGAKKAKTKWGRHMAKLPGELAQVRADGDVRRTRKLFETFYDEASGPAYDRERRALRPILEMERRGVPVNETRLAEMEQTGAKCLIRIDGWIRQRLKAPHLEIQKAAQLADAIEAVDPPILDEWIMTEPSKTHPEGVRKTSYEALSEVCSDRHLVGALRYRGVLKTQLDTFVRPWLRQESPRVYLSFNQVRSVGALRQKQMGARTGRLSSTPNLLNVPNEIQQLTAGVRKLEQIIATGRSAILVPTRGYALLDPRGCVEAPRGSLLGDNDYSQQELRITGDALPDGALARGYRRNPKMDAHDWVRDFIYQNMGYLYPRRRVKNTNFGVLYGEGIGLLAQKLGIPHDEAKTIRNACKGALGAGVLMSRFKEQGYVVTAGGRHCPVEPPSVDKQGRLRHWDYKLLNTYVQGSGGDQMKEAIIAVEEAGIVEMLLSIYDEILWEAPRRDARRLVRPVAKLMEDAMLLSVPMVADGSVGKTWRDTK
jgi:DNA polymerase-1